MQRFFLAATLGVGLLVVSYPAGASQSISPCKKACLEHNRTGTSAFRNCWDVCEGKAPPVSKKPAASKAPPVVSRDSAAAPVNSGWTAERIKRLKELRERAKGSARPGPGQRQYRTERQAAE